MSNYIKLTKSDYNRVILTDVLPYELPFIYTNEGFYKNIKHDLIKKSPFLYQILFEKKDRKPYEYTIKKDKSSDRKLYLIHPANQLNFIKLYKDYSNLITHLCSRSSFSLRAPSSIASLYYEKKGTFSHKHFRDEGVEGDIDESSPKYASSYFKYKKYDFLYKFYDSYEFHKIEKKFHSLLKLDISKCFDSISTSMLITSLRQEDVAKEAKSHNNFEQYFSKAIEQANNGRTHGIVIGPEFSRIYAEIILQSIDLNIKNDLFSKKIIEGTDYIIKRYVDDYFLFYNNANTREIVLATIKKKLEEYKLYCNESKYVHYDVPIITSVTSAKIKIQEELLSLFDIFELDTSDEHNKSTYEENPHHNISIIKTLNRHDLLANRCIRNIKSVIKDTNVDFNSITGYFFTLVKIKISELDEKYKEIDNELQEERLCRFILIVLELSFFIYSMDMRVRSTYLLSQIIIISYRLSGNLRPEKKERITKKISDESNSTLNYFIKNKPVHSLEVLNLLIALGFFKNSSRISQEKLSNILGLDNFSSGYFELMAGLHFIKKDPNYLKVKNKIINIIKEKVSNEHALDKSEIIHLLFDSMSCPYISDKKKKQIFTISLKNQDIYNDTLENIYNILSSHSWFIEWNKDASIIEKLLLKKELRTPYGN